MIMSVHTIRFRQRIHTKLSVILIILTTVLLSGHGAYQYLTLRSTSLLHLNVLAESISERLAVNLADPIWNMTTG